MASNPYDAPLKSVPNESIWPNDNEGVVEIQDVALSKANWTLKFNAQSIDLFDKDNVLVKKSEKVKFLKEFSFTPIGTKCLIVKLEKKKKVIKLTDDKVLEIIKLLGVDDWKKEYSKIGSKGMITWGSILLAISAFIFFGETKWPIELIALEILWVSAGCVMVINGIMVKKSIRPFNYILQIFSSSAILLCIIINIFTEFNWFQAFFFIIVLIGIPLAIGNYKLFKSLESNSTTV